MADGYERAPQLWRDPADAARGGTLRAVGRRRLVLAVCSSTGSSMYLISYVDARVGKQPHTERRWSGAAEQARPWTDEQVRSTASALGWLVGLVLSRGADKAHKEGGYCAYRKAIGIALVCWPKDQRGRARSRGVSVVA